MTIESAGNPVSGDDCKKLLDRKHFIVLFRNPLRTYTAVCFDGKSATAETIQNAVLQMDDYALTITDHFEPSKALKALTEKMFTTGDYAEWEEPK